MKRLLLLLALLCAPAAFAQDAKPAGETTMSAKFQNGGTETFIRWVRQNLKFPELFYESGDEVRAAVNFTITKKGVVKSVEVRGAVEKVYADELVRVISSSPYWAPAVQNGKPAEWSIMVVFDLCLRKITGPDGVERCYVGDNTVYRTVDRMPAFNGGGPKEFRAWVLSGLDGLQIDTTLRIRVGGVVEHDGRMTGLKVGVPGGKDRLLCDAIERRLNKTPVWWTPGVLQGDTVRVTTVVEMSLNPDSDRVDFVYEDQKSREVADAYLVVEQMPKFRGGDLSQFRQWVMQNVVFPQSLLEARIEGVVVVSFVIDCDGILGLVRILQSPHPELSEEVVRVLVRSPKWEPGSQDGKVVRVKYTLPVDFRMQR